MDLYCASCTACRGHESLGVALICGAALIHPFCFVLTEKILADKQNPVSIELLCSVMGLSGLLVYGIWQVVYTIPRWERLVTEEIKGHQGNQHAACNALIS